MHTRPPTGPIRNLPTAAARPATTCPKQIAHTTTHWPDTQSTDDLVDLLFLGVLVDQGDGGAELDLRAGELGNVDDVGAADLLLEIGDACLVEALLLLGGMVLGVLRQIAVGARFRDRLDDRRAVHLLAPAKLLIEGCIARGGHRYLFHEARFPLAGLSPGSRLLKCPKVSVIGDLAPVKPTFVTDWSIYAVLLAGMACLRPAT